MAACTASKAPAKDGSGISSGTLQCEYFIFDPDVTWLMNMQLDLHDRRSNRTQIAPGSQTAALEGVLNPDFLALGLGGTNLMTMLWAVAMNKRVVGVEVRGNPTLGVHWNIREDLFHQLGLIDQMMLHQYGEARVPTRDNGKLFSLADCFYSAATRSGDVVPDEVIDAYDSEQHIVGTIHHVEYIDDRYREGMPNRTVTHLPPPVPPVAPQPMKIRGDLREVLDGPSMFQASAAFIQILLRRYLEKIEELDIADGLYPRVRLFTQHRVVEKEGFGFIKQADGRMQVRIEEVTEMDFKGQTVRLRTPGSDIIDIGVPELWCIAQGANSSDAKRLGFTQFDVEHDHGDGRGPITAQADYIAGLFDLLVDGRLRRRISSHFDEEGNEYWIRQIAVGHENDPEVAWVLVQVPDDVTFDPIEAGLLPANTCESSLEYFAAYQILLQDFYLEQAALILGMEVHELKRVEQVYGPKLFSLVERMGKDARIAPNGIVAGDTFGNGHFMTSGGAMTGMIGHSFRFLEHWQRLAEGFDMDLSVRLLADRIKNDTEAWLAVSAKEFTEAVPVNFGAERAAQISARSGIDPDKRAKNVAVARNRRHDLIPLDPSDWRRLFVKNGRVISSPLPALSQDHPDLAQWMKDHPDAAMPTHEESAFDMEISDLMMGAAQMVQSPPPAELDLIDSLQEEVEQLRVQHHVVMYGTAPPNSHEVPQRRPFDVASSHSAPVHSARTRRPSQFSEASYTGGSRSESGRRTQDIDRLERKLELHRQRDALYREIEELSAQMVETPLSETAPYFELPVGNDPAALVSKLLPVASAPASTSGPTLTQRKSLSQLRPTYNRNRSVVSASSERSSRPTTSRSGSSLSGGSRATPASSVRSLSPMPELKIVSQGNRGMPTSNTNTGYRRFQ